MFDDFDDVLPPSNDPHDTVYGTFVSPDDDEQFAVNDDHPSLTAAQRNPSLCRQ